MSIITLYNRFDINAAKPLPQYDMPHATAFKCVDRRDPDRIIYALICRTDLPLRISTMMAMRGVKSQGLIMLVDYGVADWTPLGRRVMVVIYEQPIGGRVLDTPGGFFEPVGEVLFPKKVIKPLFQAMSTLAIRGVQHRSVRLDNLWWIDSSKEHLALGDCVTTPPSFDNPYVYEPLHMLLANRESRGNGVMKDDLYALGMVFIAMLAGRDFPEPPSLDEVIRTKFNYSSYSAYGLEAPIPLTLTEVIRSLVMDHEDDRWNLRALELWLNGKRANPVAPRQVKRASQPFWFEGVGYYTARELAQAMSLNWDAALAPAMDGRLEIWLRRGLEDNPIADTIMNVVKVPASKIGDPRMLADAALARALIVLDPTAPLRYRDVRMPLDAFGMGMAYAMMQKKSYRSYVEMVLLNLPQTAINVQGIQNPDILQYEEVFKVASTTMQNPAVGMGVERCAYDMNEALHCQSPLIESQMVYEVRHLLTAMDRVAPTVDAKIRPIDRHLAAFVAARWDRDSKAQYRALNDPNQDRQLIGMVSLLALLQWRLDAPPVYGLTAWIGEHLESIIQTYHGQGRRKYLEAEIPRMLKKGSLPDLYNLLDDQGQRSADAEGFVWAKAEYASAERSKGMIMEAQDSHTEHAKVTGHRVAAMISLGIAVLSAGITLLVGIS